MPVMARAGAFARSKSQKALEFDARATRTGLDSNWADHKINNMSEKSMKTRRALKKRESNLEKSESDALKALNSSMNEGSAALRALNSNMNEETAYVRPDTSSSDEADKGSKDAKEQEKKTKKLILSDEAINQMITVSNLMTEVKESIYEKIKEINEHEDAILELEYASNNLERICSTTQLIWKIEDFKHKYNEAASGKNSTLYSAPFETHKYGYKLALSFCPFGDGRAKGKYASLFFCILKTDYDAILPWPFAHKLSFSIIDQTEIPPYTSADKVQREDYVMEFTPNPVKENEPFIGRPTGFRNSSLGLPRFIPVNELRDEKYLLDDTLHIKVKIHLDNVPKL